MPSTAILQDARPTGRVGPLSGPLLKNACMNSLLDLSRENSSTSVVACNFGRTRAC